MSIEGASRWAFWPILCYLHFTICLSIHKVALQSRVLFSTMQVRPLHPNAW